MNKHENIKENLANGLRDPEMNVEKIMKLLKRQQCSKSKIAEFLRIELGIEANFQIAGI